MTVLALNAEQVCRLTGLTPAQLAYWDRTGFFLPELLGGGPDGRVYSFRDLVGLRALAVLRKRHHLPWQRLRKIGVYLTDGYDTPWLELRFFAVGNQVFYADQENEARMSGQQLGQAVMPFQMDEIRRDMESAVRRLQDCAPDQIGKIAQSRRVQENVPVIAGTRMPTRTIWTYHHAGYSTDDIFREFPSLSVKDVQEALVFEAARQRRLS